MPNFGKSARGVTVDFDILRIRQQLAAKPIVVGVNERRTFINTKDGIKTKIDEQDQVRNALTMLPTATSSSDLGDMLAVANSSIADSAAATDIENISIEIVPTT